MYVTYKPDGGDVQEWTFNPRKMASADMEAIEVTLSEGWAEFAERLMKRYTRERRALLWLLLRRQHPTLKFADVSFINDELELELDLDEKRAMRTELEKIPDPEIRELALAQIDEEIAEAEARDAPKEAGSPTSANATG